MLQPSGYSQKNIYIHSSPHEYTRSYEYSFEPTKE